MIATNALEPTEAQQDEAANVLAWLVALMNARMMRHLDDWIEALIELRKLGVRIEFARKRVAPNP